MSQLFECKVKYEKRLDDGAMKKVAEPYLIEAFNFTEAEERMIDEIAPFMTGEFEVSDIKKVRYAELFESADESADRYYKIKLVFVTLDEKSGKEKRTTQNVLVQAESISDSLKRLEEGMSGSVMDYTITAVTETAIVDIYHKENLSKEAQQLAKPEYEQD